MNANWIKNCALLTGLMLVSLTAQAAPTVALTAPADNQGYYGAPASITLMADATDSDGTITRVDFYQGNALIGTATSAPYAVTWNDVAIGAYSLTAKATDDKGASTTSAARTVKVESSAAREIYYIHSDHLNTPRLITNEQNQAVWRHSPLNEPFGAGTPEEDPDNTGNHFEFNLRFPGQYYDWETQTHYNYHRDYHPQTGRYLQSDPIGLEGGINTYAYVEGNPISFTDPEGLLSTAACANPANAAACAAAGIGARGGAAPRPIPVPVPIPIPKEKEQCKDDDDGDDPCDIILDKAQLKAAGIRGREHEVKGDELGTDRNLSKFDLCGCKNGRVVVKAHGCKGPIISVTDYRWK